MRNLFFPLLLSSFLFFSQSPLLATAPAQEEQWPNKEQLRENLGQQRKMVYIYPDRGKFAAAYREYAEMRAQPGRRFFAGLALPASAADTLSTTVPICLLGTPRSNPALAKILAKLPIQFDDHGFVLGASRYADNRDVVTLTYPDPRFPQRFMQIITGNDDAAIIERLKERSGRPGWGAAGDYAVVRGQALLVYGFFTQKAPGAPWDIDLAREENFFHKRQRVWQDSTFVVDRVGQQIPRQALLTFLDQQRALLHLQTQTLGIPWQKVLEFLPVHLVLYESAESKTLATRNASYSSWQPGDREVHIVYSDEIHGDDFVAIAEYVAWHWTGGIPNADLLYAMGVLFSESWGGESYPVWAGRLFYSNNFVPFEEIFSADDHAGNSPYLIGPELATFLQFVLFHIGSNDLRNLLRNTPATLTVTECRQRFPQPILEKWQTWCRNMLLPSPPAPIQGDESFARGFCYAQEGYAVYNGYMGHTSRAALQRLAELHVNAISITPFGYTSEPTRPRLLRRSNSPGSENDESVVAAALFARQFGMRIMLKPHILVSGGRWGWPGDIKMEDAADWPAFFREYTKWILHYAIVAQMGKFESLCAGVELVNTTLGHEQEWRTIFAKIRQIYGGQLTYAANWGDEFEKVTFWDALDVIGLDCYYPLSDKPDASDVELLRGAQRIAGKIARVTSQYKKPVLITEIGYASRPAAWIDPHRDGRGEQPDETAQRRAYEAAFRALTGQPGIAGIYWWKWPSILDDGGNRDTGFTPNGKAAEQVVARWFQQDLGDR